MKLTKSKLKQIIKEELQKALRIDEKKTCLRPGLYTEKTTARRPDESREEYRERAKEALRRIDELEDCAELFMERTWKNLERRCLLPNLEGRYWGLQRKCGYLVATFDIDGGNNPRTRKCLESFSKRASRAFEKWCPELDMLSQVREPAIKNQNIELTFTIWDEVHGLRPTEETK